MKTKFVSFLSIIIVVFVGLSCNNAGSDRVSIFAGASECNITPPVGLEIQHYFRENTGVHDSLFARCLYLEDQEGTSLAIICLDMIYGGFQVCDELRKEIREKTGIENTLINFSHTHSSVALGPSGHTTISNDTNSSWNDHTLKNILIIVQQAVQKAEPVSLRVGRAQAQVGFNRRLLDETTGHVYMGDNPAGPVVPWVNVMIADSKRTGKPLAVLFEHAAHPVIVPHKSKLISADYPGAAVSCIKESLGSEVVTLFGQGCCGNINGYPLRSTHEKADEAGKKLGDAVLKAIQESMPLESNTFRVRFTRAMLPTAPLPTLQEWEKMYEEYNNASQEEMNRYDSEGEWSPGVSTASMRLKQLTGIRELIDRGEEPSPRRFEAGAVMFGNEWCLIALSNEMFCQYELWIDEQGPFKYTMTFSNTNGSDGYIATDEALSMGHKGGYEAAKLPNWSGQVFDSHFGPPAVGCEKIIKNNILSLWEQDN